MRKRIEEKKRLSGMQLAQLINLLIHVSFSFFIILRKSTSIRLRLRVFSYNLKRQSNTRKSEAILSERWSIDHHLSKNYVIYKQNIKFWRFITYIEHPLSDLFSLLLSSVKLSQKFLASPLNARSISCLCSIRRRATPQEDMT